MNLWLRLLALIVAALWRPRLAGPRDVSRLSFRVWPHDLDTSLHMNNGRYWTLMDLGRTDLVIRTGLWRAVLRGGWVPVISAGSVRFRRELRLFERFALETHVLAWTDTFLVMEHRLIRADGAVAALALVKGALYDRKARAFVPIQTILAAMGRDEASPPMPQEAQAMLAADAAMRASSASSDAA